MEQKFVENENVPWSDFQNVRQLCINRVNVKLEFPGGGGGGGGGSNENKSTLQKIVTGF